MDYAGKYAELSCEEKINWLKKQRKGLIIGDFRNHLYAVYIRIRKTCDLLNANQCSYEEAFSENGIPRVYDPLECCMELFRLGYINVKYEGARYILAITAEVDF